MNKLTPEHLLILNRKLGGDGRLRRSVDIDVLKDIAAKPYEKTKELLYKHKRVVDKAAVLGYMIVARSPFVARNNETAVLAMLTLLELNGYRVIDYVNDMEVLLNSLVQQKQEEEQLNEIRQWIVAHLAKDDYKISYLNE